jgi:predicted PurR-regulated permease PerM
MQTKILERYFFFILLFSTLIFSFAIFSPFWIAILLGISFSIVLFPVYQWFKKMNLPNWLSSLFTVLIFIIIICGLLFGLGLIILNQSQGILNIVGSGGNTFSFISHLNNSINKLLPMGVSFNLSQKILDLFSLITNNIASLFTTTLSTLFTLFLTVLSMFYFLKDNERCKTALKKFSPLSEEDNEKIMDKFALSVNGIMRGYFLVAFIQATLVTIGFTIFGVPNPMLWGMVAMLTSFVPTIGSGLVSVPAIIFLFVTGNSIQALGLFIWAVIMVATIDNILNPVIVSNRIKLHPLLILFSVLGGISLFGPIGIIVGPLTISLLYTLIYIYRDEFKEQY